MGFYLWPLMVLLFFLSLVGIERHRSVQSAPASVVTQAVQAGEAFVAYRNAVMAYQDQHQSFVGTVPANQLGGQFSADFLAAAGNAVTATGATGRIVTCYALLPAGAIATVLDVTDHDASFGFASGATWTSLTPGTTAQPLAVAVPDGAVVSILQMGK
ncbi:type IV pilus biogenesis protein PilM [Desulfobulbus elongatus]|uniref:type IV pilus biogenesis protein PilM n=1 Tax=Desulfobulbus elongatus TaxID=53332 RepID=UPI000480D539|nr:type IV pilus biogenesis protein PilM [Desulfobulbus elongatus]